jgi:hypothetical protein
VNIYGLKHGYKKSPNTTERNAIYTAVFIGEKATFSSA